MERRGTGHASRCRRDSTAAANRARLVRGSPDRLVRRVRGRQDHRDLLGRPDRGSQGRPVHGRQDRRDRLVRRVRGRQDHRDLLGRPDRGSQGHRDLLGHRVRQDRGHRVGRRDPLVRQGRGRRVRRDRLVRRDRGSRGRPVHRVPFEAEVRQGHLDHRGRRHTERLGRACKVRRWPRLTPG